MKMILKNKKGMTLTELLVGIIIFSLVTAVASTMLMSILNVYTRANDIAEYDTLLDNVANRIIADLSSSTDAPSYDGVTLTITTATVTIDYSVSGGVLLRNGTAVLEKDYYKGKGVAIACASSGSAGAYTLTVTVSSDDGGATVSRDYAVRPLALNQY